MAIDWTWTADSSYVHKVKRDLMPAAIVKFEDGTESRRLKSIQAPMRWTEKFSVNAVTLKAMLDFWHLRGTVVSFVKASYDARDNPDEATTEINVRFASAPSYDQIAANRFHVSWTFERVY